MVIADSTVWVQYLRAPGSAVGEELRRLLDAGEVLLTGPVLTEILQGAREDAGFTALRSSLAVIPYIETPRRAWIRTAELSRQLRAHGKITPLLDLLIAATALEGDHQVFTLDEHFRRVPGLRLHEASGA